MAVIKAAIYAVAQEYQPCTVRQIYYQLVSRGVIDKTEAEYKTVVRLLAKMRRNRELPYGWVADNSRWMRKPDSHDSIQAALEDSIQCYRRNVWRDVDAYVEIWLEKEALSGVLWEATSEWDVPLMVTRGYPSLTFLHEASEAISDLEKPAYLYYFGDLDPSGMDISRHVEQSIYELAPYADVKFERVAVQRWQVHLWNLPTRPTKKTDTRAGNFTGESVEVDAIDPPKLRELVEDCVTQHIDKDTLLRNEATEQAERETTERLMESISGLLGGVQ